MGQIKIPRTSKGLADLVEKIREKNSSDGDQSILNAVIDLDGMEARVLQMMEYEKKADDANRLKEEMNEQKNKAIQEITKEVQRVRNILKAQYTDDQRKLGAWGFNVDNVKPKKVKEIV